MRRSNEGWAEDLRGLTHRAADGNVDGIAVEVRNIHDQVWREHWSKEKLAYFILMSELAEPKFQQSEALQWVTFQGNAYCWDKGALTLEEFDAITAPWPRSKPVTFSPMTCDRVQFSWEDARGAYGVGFNPTTEPDLFARLLHLTEGKLQYREFNYAAARHVFVLTLDEPAIVAMNAGSPPVARLLRRVDDGLSEAIRGRSARNGKVTFLCKEGTFEVPITLWFES